MCDMEGMEDEKTEKKKTQFKFSAGAIVFYLEEGKPVYLLLKYKNYWGFAKGIIEKGEKSIDAALREIGEEAGLKKENLQIIEGFREKQGWFFQTEEGLVRKQATFFLARANTKEVKISGEHEDFKWLSLEEALAMMKIKANRELLEKADKFLNEKLIL